MQRSKTYREVAESFDQDEIHAPLAAIGAWSSSWSNVSAVAR